MSHRKLWAKVNKCVLCGTSLKFKSSQDKNAQVPDGEKYCEQNHRRFSVYGKFHASGDWVLTFRLPL